MLHSCMKLAKWLSRLYSIGCKNLLLEVGSSIFNQRILEIFALELPFIAGLVFKFIV